MLPDDLPAASHFDAFLDALATDQSTDPFANGLDLDLLTKTRRLHSTPLAPAPDPTFARELRRSFLGQMAATAPEKQRGSVLGVMTALPPPTWKRRRWWPRLEFATMLGVFAVLLLIISGDGNPTAWWTTNSPENKDRGRTELGTSTAHQSASNQSSASAPSNCPGEPITSEKAKSLAGTPAQNLQPTPTARPATGDLGVPVDTETANEIKQVIEIWLACLNAGDVWRALPLYSQSYIGNHFLPNQPGLFWEPEAPGTSATPTSLSPEQWKVLLAVLRVNQVAETLVAADVVLRFPSAVEQDGSFEDVSFQTRLFLVKTNDAWLIDEMSLPGNSFLRALAPRIGDELVVTDTVSVHEQPTVDSTVIAELTTGTRLSVTNPPVEVDGETWIQVLVPKTAQTGWIPNHYVPASSLATATVSPPSFVVGDTVQTKQPATIYPEPSAGSMSVLTLTGPSVVTGSDRWWPVSVAADGTSGYILESVLQPYDPNASVSSPTVTPINAGIASIDNQGIFTSGVRVVVISGDVRMRFEPSTEATIVAIYDEGTVLVVLEGPVEGDGYVWWHVLNETTGAEGWVVEDWLGPVDDAGTRPSHTPGPTAELLFRIGDNVETKQAATIYHEPSITSMSVVTVIARTMLTLTGPAVWDGDERWWPVEVARSREQGYILESSLLPSAASGVQPTVTINTASTPTVVASSTRFAVGATVFVASEHVVMRNGPSFDGAEVTTLAKGTRLSIRGTSVTVQNVVWWPVGDVTTGLSGFVVEEGLTDTLATPTPEP